MRLRACLLVGWLLLAGGCTKRAAPPAGPFRDDFNRAVLGPDWSSNNPEAYRLVDGQLHIQLAHNQPLWLTRPIPRNVRIDFDCSPREPAVDMKVEVFGDGERHESAADIARDAQYTASGYVFIFGGWHNQLSTLVRQAEHEWQHERGVPMRRDVRGIPGRWYHWTIRRQDRHVAWDLDGQPFLQLDDPAPLAGPGHDRFAFDGWESEVVCDNLEIVPLPG
jgi:hypothetical protein